MYHYAPLLTDQYQLVMAYCYWQLGMAEQQAVFNLSFNKLPLQSSFILAAGLQQVIDFITHFKFSQEDLRYLGELRGEGGRLFPEEFLCYLEQLTLTCNIDAIPEGTVVFAKEPLIRVTGPILQCQLLETALLNFINFSSLIATKGSQVCIAANGDPVIEFGLRRAQGPDGGLMASRSAYIGGCHGTSNVLAGKIYGIPLYGTQAHSWIMAFPTEIEAFKRFAAVIKSNTSLLVDTYNTLQGVRHAIKIGKRLKKKGEHLAAIRLDSGNLLELSQKARLLLDRAGLNDTKIMASGDLDEHIIRVLKENNAPIDSWGVGTRLVTSYDQPAFNAVYKLSALKNGEGKWDYRMKISDDLNKLTLPGLLQVERLYRDNIPQQDIIYDTELQREPISNVEYDSRVDLLKPIIKQGRLIYSVPSLTTIRDQALKQIQHYTEQTPKPYPVVISSKLQCTMEELMQQLKTRNLSD